MSHWRKIDVRIWNDEKFNALSPTGKLSFFMLLTHPLMTALGAMRGTPEGLACEIGMDAEPFREGFEELLATQMAEYDPIGRLIALPNFLKYNVPDNPNVVKSWSKSVEFLPECPLRTLVIQRARSFTERLGERFGKALPEPFLQPENREQRAESRAELSPYQEGETLKGKRSPSYDPVSFRRRTA